MPSVLTAGSWQPSGYGQRLRLFTAAADGPAEANARGGRMFSADELFMVGLALFMLGFYFGLFIGGHRDR